MTNLTMLLLWVGLSTFRPWPAVVGLVTMAMVGVVAMIAVVGAVSEHWWWRFDIPTCSVCPMMPSCCGQAWIRAAKIDRRQRRQWMRGTGSHSCRRTGAAQVTLLRRVAAAHAENTEKSTVSSWAEQQTTGPDTQFHTRTTMKKIAVALRGRQVFPFAPNTSAFHKIESTCTRLVVHWSRWSFMNDQYTVECIAILTSLRKRENDRVSLTTSTCAWLCVLGVEGSEEEEEEKVLRF